MTKSLFRNFASLAYALFQIGQGLLLHPYQTMRSLIEKPVFSWLVFLPIFFLGVGKIIWHLVLVPLGQWFFSPLFGAGFMTAFLVRWVSYFCWLWQLILIYLLIRFFWAFWGKK